MNQWYIYKLFITTFVISLTKETLFKHTFCSNTVQSETYLNHLSCADVKLAIHPTNEVIKLSSIRLSSVSSYTNQLYQI